MPRLSELARLRTGVAILLLFLLFSQTLRFGEQAMLKPDPSRLSMHECLGCCIDSANTCSGHPTVQRFTADLGIVNLQLGSFAVFLSLCHTYTVTMFCLSPKDK